MSRQAFQHPGHPTWMPAGTLLGKNVLGALLQQATASDINAIAANLARHESSRGVVPSDITYRTSACAAINERVLNLVGDRRTAEVLMDSGHLPASVPREKNARMEEDAVTGRLTEALAAAENDESELGAIFADAIRLVVAARMMSNVTKSASPALAGLSKWRLKRVVEYVAQHFDKKVRLKDMASAARLSRMHFAALFMRSTGLTPHQYLLRQRIAVAQEMLRTTDKQLVEIALNVGFGNQQHFTTVFKGIVGQTPSKWRASKRIGPPHSC
jgi:AraC family transcriptional regulator